MAKAVNKQQLKVLGLVGARSGSKGVPDKNIKLLDGVPLVGRIIEKARKSKHINRVVVSTDSETYREVARTHGADVPFLRPAELSTDKSPEFEYVKHALRWLKENEGYEPDMVVRMMATVPLQATEDIDACIEELLKDPAADSAVVIAEARQHPVKALKLMDDGAGGKKLVSYFTESGREVTPLARQTYEKAYFRANIIACHLKTIYNTDSLTGDLVRYHIIPQVRAVDIDSPADFMIAEQLIEYLKRRPDRETEL
jgi:CMP-N-acetylneuraminic acid synthetase